MKKSKKPTRKNFYTFLLYMICLSVFEWRDLHYFIVGWKSLGLENGRFYNIAASPDSGSLVADDSFFLDHTFYYYPAGSNDLSNFKLYNLKERKFRAPVCFYAHEQRIFTPGDGKNIFNLNSGLYEDLPDVFSSHDLYDCTTLGNGDLLISAEQSLIFYRAEGWESIEIPDLDQHFQVTIDQGGVIWIGTADGHLLTYNIEQDILTSITDISKNPVIKRVPLKDQHDREVNVIGDIQSLPDGRLLIQHGDKKLFVWGMGSEEEEIFKLDVDSYSFVVDRDSGLILANTEHQIFAFTVGNYNQMKFIPLYLSPESIAGIALDSNRNILYISGFDDVYYREIKD